MRPVEMTVEGLRSFRNPERITFADRELVAIIGDTGAGKSSILEALTWALYGNATWTKQAGVLIGDGSPQMRVRLVFRAAGHTWRVTRAVKRRQDGTPGPASAELVCLDGELPAADGVRPVNDAVQKLLGLDWDAFTRTVVLPQGQFARLLTEGDVDRMRILAQIWRTDDLLAARSHADEALRDLEGRLERWRGRRDGYPGDVAAELATATASAEKAEAAARRIDATVGRVTECQLATDEAGRRAEAIRAAVQKLEGSLDGDLAAEAAALATAGAALTRQHRDLDARIRERRQEIDRLEDAESEQAAERDAVAAALRTLERLDDALPDLAANLGRVAGLDADAARRRSEAEDLAEDVEKAERRLADAEDAVAHWQRADAAATAAHGLHAGDSCPVCARPLPEAWDAPDASGLSGALQEQETARTEAGTLQARLTRATAEAEATAKQAADEAAALARRLTRITAAVAELPEAYRPALPAPFTVDALSPDDLTAELGATARSAAGTRLDELSATERDLRTARDTLQDLREERTSVQDRLSAEVFRPATGLRSRMQRICERVRGCEEAGVGLPAAVPELGEELDQLAEEATAVASVAEAALERSASAAREAQDEAVAQSQQLTALLQLADVTSVDELTANQLRLRVEATQQRQRARDLERMAPVVAALDEHLAKGGEAVGALADLKMLLQDGRFVRWLTLRRSKALLAVASTLLDEMTGGRYAFADITDEHDEWRIFDTQTGHARSPRTLSGGESFVASLALALGMVEMVARSGGRLDALFLDEGFGALDRENLDAAIDALESSATRGRMVVVVSHVQAVAERLTDVLAVDRTPTGSQVRWLTQSEREGVAVEDATTSVLNLLT